MARTKTNQRSAKSLNADHLSSAVAQATSDLKKVATRTHDKLSGHKMVIDHWGERWDHLNAELPEATEKLAAFADAATKFADFVDVTAEDLYRLSNGWRKDFAALIGMAQMFTPETMVSVDVLQQSYKMEHENAKKVSANLRDISSKASSLGYYLHQLQVNLQKLPADQREKNTSLIPLIQSAFKHLFDGCEIFERCTPPSVYSEPFFMTTAAENFQNSIVIMGAVNSTSLIR